VDFKIHAERYIQACIESSRRQAYNRYEKLSVKIDTVFLHGWAMNSAVWQPCLQQLPDSINPLCIDLPGHGDRVNVSAGTLDEYVEHVARQIAGPVLLVGWSLGGLVSLRLAQRYPEKVSALFQVAANPKFVQDSGWPTAIEASVFDQFASSLEKDRIKTIRRFLALQVRGTDTSIQTVRELQAAIDERGLPDIEALFAGLKLLSDTDLTEALQALDCPVSWLLGDKDALVPIELARVLRQMSADIDIHVVAGAGHAPFISHPEEFVQALLHAAKG
jgi:pimeloyl-[acyl-carrier protein] methyl ester esterase